MKLTAGDTSRFWAYIKRELNTCWIWKGPLSHGDPILYVRLRGVRACRIAYHLVQGRMPRNIFRTCSSRLCCNPKHFIDHKPRSRSERLFLSKVKQGAKNKCWPYQGALEKKGYGVFHKQKAHRFMYRLHYGIDPGRKYVLHSCNNPSCVNPRHLSLGTQYDNMRYMMRCGRHRCHRGDSHPASKLTGSIVRSIRKSTLPTRVLSKRYGVTPGTIHKIRRRETWTHL